jgi:hypothetical protein
MVMSPISTSRGWRVSVFGIPLGDLEDAGVDLDEIWGRNG